MRRGMGMMFQKAGGGSYSMQPKKHNSMKTQAPKNYRAAMEAKEASLKESYVQSARQKSKKFSGDWFDDDEEDDNHGYQSSKSAGQRMQSGVSEQEVDPLDAFMAGIDQTVKNQKASSATDFAKPEIMSNTEADYEQSTAGNAGLAARQDSDYDSEAEIYAAEANELDAEGRVPEGKKRIEPLAKIDHSTIQYENFRKEFYSEHPEVRAMSQDEVDYLRRRLECYTEGHRCPRPLPSFKHAGFDPKLLQTIVKHGLETPTPIQAQAIPVAMSGRDMIGIAKTGSGKTYAFVWPILTHVMDQRLIEKGEGPIAVILSPTRELASQIYAEAKKYAKPFGAKVCALIGGSGKWEMQKALREGPEIVVATPGRLIEMIKSKSTNLHRCTMVVLDEADRMFEMGFEYQMRSIVGQIRPDRQTLMFSATFKKRIQALARDVLRDPIKVTVGLVGQANEDINQIITVMHDSKAKWRWLADRLAQFVAAGKVLIFVTHKDSTEELSKNITLHLRIQSESIHGDKDQHARSLIMSRFKKGEVQVLVATDVAARGLDIKGVNTVVNYDAAKNIETHIHRVGRTGRMGVDGHHPGTAHTLVCQTESAFAFDLCRNLEVSGQRIPEELEKLASRTGRAKRSMAGIGFGGPTQSYNQVPPSFQRQQAPSRTFLKQRGSSESWASQGGQSSHHQQSSNNQQTASKSSFYSNFTQGSNLGQSTGGGQSLHQQNPASNSAQSSRSSLYSNFSQGSNLGHATGGTFSTGQTQNAQPLPPPQQQQMGSERKRRKKSRWDT